MHDGTYKIYVDFEPISDIIKPFMQNYTYYSKVSDDIM